MPTTYSPNYRLVPCVNEFGATVNIVNAAIWVKRRIPQPFQDSGAVASAPKWNTFEMSPAEYGIYYKFEWYIENVSEPVTYSMVSGALPTGLSLTSVGGARGRIDGTPTALGTFTFALRATNANGSADHTFSIEVSAIPVAGFVL